MGILQHLSSILQASEDLKGAKNFKKLLRVSGSRLKMYYVQEAHLLKIKKLILLLGNFMNGNTFRGGAFGIRISSINKVEGLIINSCAYFEIN